MWCCDVVQRVKKMCDEEIKILVKWEKEFLDVGENEVGKEILKKCMWNPETPGKGAWRQDMQDFLKKTE